MDEDRKPSEDFLQLMDNERRNWSRAKILYAVIHIATRVFLITASAVVAAVQGQNPPASQLAASASALALAVTIVTSIDTWLKPAVKWQIYSSDQDDLEEITLRAKLAQHQSQYDKHESLLAEFSRLRKAHRQRVNQ